MKNIKINEQYHKELKKEAVITDITLTELMDSILDVYLNKEKIGVINER